MRLVLTTPLSSKEHVSDMPIIISKKGSHSAEIVNRADFALERNLQDYIWNHPEAIPVAEKRLLVVARELQTESGAIDAFAVDDDGNL
jgi:RecB family endonuclease NucS